MASTSRGFNYVKPNNIQHLQMKRTRGRKRKTEGSCRPFDPKKRYLGTCKVPLKDEEHKCWQEFKVFAAGAPILCGIKMVQKCKRPIGVDHPIVGVACQFAVTAFNESCRMAKKNRCILHNCVIKNCKFLKMTSRCYFYITIEAIEEGDISIFEAHVAFESNDGSISLSKFFRVGGPRIVDKVMAMNYLSSLRSVNRSVKDLAKDVRTYLERTHEPLEGKKKGKLATALTRQKLQQKKAIFKKWTRVSQVYGGNKGRNVANELLCLKEQLNNTMAGLHKVLHQDTRTLYPSASDRMAIQDDDDSDDDDYDYVEYDDARIEFYFGLKRRGYSSGYDFETIWTGVGSF